MPDNDAPRNPPGPAPFGAEPDETTETPAAPVTGGVREGGGGGATVPIEDDNAVPVDGGTVPIEDDNAPAPAPPSPVSDN